MPQCLLFAVGRLLAIPLCVLFLATFGHAHEGHRPLPTRGMEVDTLTGKMVLSAAARDTLDVQTAELANDAIAHTITCYGSLVTPWTRHALVSSPLAGRIVELHVVPGQSVRAGQLLAELECPDLEQLQLDLRLAQIESNLSSRLTDSATTSTQSGAVAGIKLVEAQTRLQQSQAAIEIASQKWRGLRLPASMLEEILRSPHQEHRQRLALLSPIDGLITHTDLSLGKVVDPQEHLLEVIDLSTIWLKIGVLEKDIASIRSGQSIEFTLGSRPEESFAGKIDVVDRYLDPETHLGTAWATIANGSEKLALLPGMAGQVRIHRMASGQGLVVPIAAIVRDGAERFVMIESEHTQVASTYQKQAVVLGQRSGDFVEVRGGSVFPGDRVVTRGSHELGGFFAKGTLTVSRDTALDIGLVVQPVEQQKITQTISIDGIVDLPPTQRAVASSQLGGTIERICVDRGQTVKRGDVLAEVLSQEFQNLQLELLRVDLDVDLYQTAAENAATARSGISERQRWEAEAKFHQSISRRDTICRQLRNVGLDEIQIEHLIQTKTVLGTLPVLAPMDGTLVGFDKFLGYVVRPDEPLFEIHNLERAWVQGYLSERDLARVQVGQPVRARFVAMPDEVVEGVVARSGQSLSTEDRTLSIWVELQQMPTFVMQHNMLARLTVETGDSFRGVAVPREAVVSEGTRSYVFVRGSDGIFERRLVRVGRSDDRLIEVRTGLELGESIAIRGTAGLQSGYAGLK